MALNGIAPFGVLPGQHIRMDVLGLKLRVAGDAVLDADTWMPRLPWAWAQAVRPGSLQSVFDFVGPTRNRPILRQRHQAGAGQSLLLSATLRSTCANQNGLLGFGAGRAGAQQPQPAARVFGGLALRRDLAIGAEVRFNPTTCRPRAAQPFRFCAARRRLERHLHRLGASKIFRSPWPGPTSAGWCPGITNGRRQSGAYFGTGCLLTREMP